MFAKGEPTDAFEETSIKVAMVIKLTVATVTTLVTMATMVSVVILYVGLHVQCLIFVRF
jgi:hypothetical protein